jgi:small subunit ribosomal protein S14
MAKTSMIEREKRRAKLVKQHAAKRAQLKEAIRSPKSTDSEREEATRKLQSMPRDTSASRMRNRCAITGRSRGVIANSPRLPQARGDHARRRPGSAQGQLVGRVRSKT